MASLSPIPIVRDADVLVLGASSAAVAAADEAARSGRTAFLAGDLSYLGADLAGRLRLCAGPGDLDDPLLHAAYGDGPDLARPTALKRALEEALREAGVSFLYQARPVALLRDGDGALAGAVLATRSGLLGVTCRTILDATGHGLAARLAGFRPEPRNGAPSPVRWTVLAKEPPREWPGEVEELPRPFRQETEQGAETWRLFRLGIDRARLGDDLNAREHVLRSLLLDENVHVTADFAEEEPEEEFPARLSPHLWRVGGPLSEARRIARAAAESAPGLPAKSLSLWPQEGDAGTYGFASAFVRRAERTVAPDGWAAPRLDGFDVVVAGGGTGGAPAGIGAARAGARTLVLEAQRSLGGVGTVGLIASYWFGNKVGFTAELNAEVQRHDSLSRAKGGNRWSPEVKAAVYHRLLQAAGGRAWTGSFAFGVRMEGRRVAGLLVSTPRGCGWVEAGCVVDATGNADVAAAAGAPCRTVDARHLAVQGSGLSPRFHPGVRHYNSDHTFLDDSDPLGATAAHAQARAKFPGGFDTSPLLDTRERRQIVGELELSPLDLLAERTFPDTLFTASSNFDTHGFTIHPVFMAATPDHKPLRANVPFRCMLPRGVDGVVVTGLGMSAHRDALPVIRMQADVQNQGYAAGLAAAEAAARGVPVRAIDLPALQRRLAAIGILPGEAGAEGWRDSFPLDAAAVDAALAGDWGSLKNAAILFAHPERSREPLRAILRREGDPRRAGAALLLGLMGEAEAAPVLAERVRAAAWDAGWNYRGMGQFGASMSPLDAAIIALARTGDPRGAGPIAEKIAALDGAAAFSHCRAVSLAAAVLPDPRLADGLAALLRRPGMRGHAWTSLAGMLDRASADSVEDGPRNLALRELHLARGLFAAGDRDGLGRAVLAEYADDLRGPFARHARAVLAHPDPAALRAETA